MDGEERIALVGVVHLSDRHGVAYPVHVAASHWQVAHKRAVDDVISDSGEPEVASTHVHEVVELVVEMIGCPTVQSQPSLFGRATDRRARSDALEQRAAVAAAPFLHDVTRRRG